VGLTLFSPPREEMIQREAIVFSGKHQDKKQQRQTGRHAKKIAQLRFTLLLMS
jgi:hypothetical protein